MSVKRALGVLACAIAAGGVGSAVLVGTSASGSPAAPAAPLAAPPVALAPRVQAAPKTTLSLPTTLHLINHTTDQVSPGGASHLVLTGALTRHGAAAGSAVYTCVKNSQGNYSCDSAFALAGGLILSHETVSGSQFSGAVNGGTGKFAGASGSIKATTRSDGNQKLTISYSVG